ncbi:Vanillate O-demethylase oxidoreductase [Pluralibacter gergoviae]|uniref:PDR/VanB family oxidoreductase n=1 Tax=Pluralibacter gergoviae TaxID=61647 RepID=UPI000651EA1C|nr:PDR/VanB family oxidoreductase [Pluralibacter gergoviae]KMK17365.1 Vanillate O-demethylase oxidoreductase [Pluralibacter gergoviae]
MPEVIVLNRQVVAEGICTFELVSATGQELPPFTAGAHIDVHLSPGVIRQYSLCNSPKELHRYVIGVLNEPASRGGSRYMHEQVKPGQTLKISEPRNLFPLVAASEHSILFAGGIGITPMLAMAYTLADEGRSFELHYCCRTAGRAAFVNTLKTCPFAAQIFLHFDDREEEQKLDIALVLSQPQPGHHLYVCGPGGFMDFVLSSAATFGWQEDQVHREYFSAPAADVESTGDTAFEVELASSGQVFVIPPEQTVIEVLSEAGIDIPTSCEQGVCGSCLTRVLDGIPDHRDQVMNTKEHAANDRFTPCCSRAKSARLVLDL